MNVDHRTLTKSNHRFYWKVWSQSRILAWLQSTSQKLKQRKYQHQTFKRQTFELESLPNPRPSRRCWSQTIIPLIGTVKRTQTNVILSLTELLSNRDEDIIGSIGRVVDIKCEEDGQWKAITFVTTDSNSFHSRISTYEVWYISTPSSFDKDLKRERNRNGFKSNYAKTFMRRIKQNVKDWHPQSKSSKANTLALNIN